jgi:hypothetical protein
MEKEKMSFQFYEFSKKGHNLAKQEILSPSMLQRHLVIGYEKSSILFDLMKETGMIQKRKKRLKPKSIKDKLKLAICKS